MHELAITENIISIAVEHAKKSGADKIVSIDLVIGELTNIVDDSVQFYFDIVSKGSPAENAKLNIRRLPSKIKCHNCENIFEPIDMDFYCPSCGELTMEFVQGHEFFIESITTE